MVGRWRCFFLWKFKSSFGIRSMSEKAGSYRKGNATPLRHLKRKRFVDSKLTCDSAPSNVYLQVIQSGCDGFGRCLFLFTDFTRYFFNCPEGSQRLCSQYGVKISRLEQIFFTHGHWLNTGGLPGMALTLRDVGVPSVSITGPPGIGRVFEAARSFAEDPMEMPIVEKSLEEPFYRDSAITVEAVPLYSDQQGSTGIGSLRDCAVAYICRLTPKPGRMDIKKCLDMGIPVGPMLGQLQMGQTVTLPDGRTVAPLDVQEAQNPQPLFVVVECPNLTFLPALIHAVPFQLLLQQIQADPTIVVGAFVHMSPAEVLSDRAYQSWTSLLSSDETSHLVMNEWNSPTCHSEAIFKQQTTLNYLSPRFFPSLGVSRPAEAPVDLGSIFCPRGRVVRATPALKFNLRPANGLSAGPAFDTSSMLEAVRAEVRSISDFEEVSQSVEKATARQLQDIQSNDYPEVVFLGTGSAIPSKYRNVSSILLNITSTSSLLLDCGENSYSQLFQLYGPVVTDEILCRIGGVFISHLHADHHLGLFTLLSHRQRAFERLGLQFEKAVVIAAAPLFKMQRLYSETVEDVTSLLTPIPSVHQNLPELLQRLSIRLGVKQLELVKVIHPMMAFGIVVYTNCGRKIVFSGDTRPCPALVQAGHNCDLLIHEATMEDQLGLDAAAKNHSTTGEAIGVGRAMGAAHTILTHFSSRYPVLPVVSEEFDDRVSIAFDFLRLRISDVRLFPPLIPLLRAVFWEKHDDLMQRQERRQLKKQVEQTQVALGANSTRLP